MERLDAIVATVGAVILLVAIGGAALTSGASRSSFDVSFPTHDHAVALEARTPIPDRQTTAFALEEPNLVKVNVSLQFTSTAPFSPTTSVHAKLTGPNGTKEVDAAPASGASAFEIKLDVPLASAPPALTSSATDAMTAEHGAWAKNSTLGQGNWTLEVSFTSGASFPTTPPGQSLRTSYAWTAWDAKAQPAAAAPASR